MASRNIEVWSDYDISGRWVLKIRKKKGKFSKMNKFQRKLWTQTHGKKNRR